MATIKETVLTRLAAEIDRSIEAFQALRPDDWEIKVYADGAAWTPREILAHQVTTEIAIRRLVEDILAGGEGAPEDFRVQEFNEKQAARLAEQSPDELYAALRAARAAMIATVEPMTLEDFARTGRHPWFGRAELADVLKLVYRHNMLHVRDVQKAVRGPHDT